MKERDGFDTDLSNSTVLLDEKSAKASGTGNQFVNRVWVLFRSVGAESGRAE